MKLSSRGAPATWRSRGIFLLAVSAHFVEVAVPSKTTQAFSGVLLIIGAYQPPQRLFDHPFFRTLSSCGHGPLEEPVIQIDVRSHGRT
jgi:hypothetical protein